MKLQVLKNVKTRYRKLQKLKTQYFYKMQLVNIPRKPTLKKCQLIIIIRRTHNKIQLLCKTTELVICS